MQNHTAIVAVFLCLLLLPLKSFAHTPLMACFDNGDETITCGGGFSDGATASGVPMRVETMDGNILLEGKINEEDEFSFDKPKVDFVVVFDAGPSHIIRENSKDIFE